MNWNEVGHFTWNDLSSFTWNDLSLDKYELIAKVENGSLLLSDDVQSKLRDLCTELSERVPERKPFLSNFSLKTVGDAATILLTFVQIAKGLDDINISMRIKQIYDFIQSQL